LKEKAEIERRLEEQTEVQEVVLQELEAALEQVHQQLEDKKEEVWPV